LKGIDKEETVDEAFEALRIDWEREIDTIVKLAKGDFEQSSLQYYQQILERKKEKQNNISFNQLTSQICSEKRNNIRHLNNKNINEESFMKLLSEKNTPELQSTNDQIDSLKQENKVSDLSSFEVENSNKNLKNPENEPSNLNHIAKKEAAPTSAASNKLSTQSFGPADYNEILDFNFLFNTVTSKVKMHQNGFKAGLVQNNEDQNCKESGASKNMTTHEAIIASLQKLKTNFDSNEKSSASTEQEQKTVKPKTKKTLSKMTEVERNNYLLFGSDYGEDFSEDDLDDDYAEMSPDDNEENDEFESKVVDDFKNIDFDEKKVVGDKGLESGGSYDNLTSETTNSHSGSNDQMFDKGDSKKAKSMKTETSFDTYSNKKKTNSNKNKAYENKISYNNVANSAKLVKLPEKEFIVSENFLCLSQQSCQFKAINSELQVRKISNSASPDFSILKQRNPFSNGQKTLLNITIYPDSCVKIGITASNLKDYDLIQENSQTRLMKIKGGNCTFSGISQNRSLGVFHCSVEAELRDDVVSFYDVTTAEKIKLFEVGEIIASDWMFVAICHGNVDIS